MNKVITHTTTVSHFEIQSLSDGVKFYAKVINKNARKIHNAQVAYYSFKTLQDRDLWVKNTIEAYTAHEARKEARKAERKAYKTDLKPGDILSGTWGYDQTNVEFYKVIAVKGSMVEVRELAQKTVQDSTYSHGMADMRLPSESFVADAPVLKRLAKSPYIKVNECISLSKWDGRPEYCSWYA